MLEFNYSQDIRSYLWYPQRPTVCELYVLGQKEQPVSSPCMIQKQKFSLCRQLVCLWGKKCTRMAPNMSDYSNINLLTGCFSHVHCNNHNSSLTLTPSANAQFHRITRKWNHFHYGTKPTAYFRDCRKYDPNINNAKIYLDLSKEYWKSYTAAENPICNTLISVYE